MSQVAGQVYVPPDPFGDAGQGFTPLRFGAGQIVQTDGDPLSDCSFYYENTPVGIHLRKKGMVSYTFATLHHDSVTSDTLYRIDMQLGQKERDPVHHGNPVHGLANYYLGDITVEQVKAVTRAIYRECWDSVDVHFFYGGTGPRMAFVIRPGGDPDDVKLNFTGQDSLKVDWQGALKIYLDGKWVKLEQAIAYQVDGNGFIVPVNWTADYVVENGNVSVGFEYESFNPAWPLILQIGYPPAMLGGAEDYRNLNWSTFAGGSGGDELECVEVDDQGDPYMCGYATSYFFPIAVGFTVHTPFVSDPTGSWSAVIMKVEAATKITQWATYYGGYNGGKWTARTKAHKLAVDATENSAVNHVFVTGSTNCTDFSVAALPNTDFSLAINEPYNGGITRMWVAAFQKSTGMRDWATTHGEAEDVSWSEHGLAIDVDAEGLVVVGGQLESLGNANVVAPAFQLATPQSGAWSRAVGGGFFIVFDNDYQIDWATTFGEFTPSDAFTKVTDLRIARVAGSGKKVIWLTGTSSTDTGDPLDVVEIPGAFYQPTANGPTVMIARIDINDQHQIEYCTRWGNTVAEAYGLELTGKSLWVVGYTSETNLTSTQCPNPGGSGVHHTATHAGTTFAQGSDGFILRFNLAPFDLDYGTLIGGTRDDILLDVNSHDASRVFITGETRSNSGFDDDINSNYYYQMQNDYWDRRDAVILSLADQPAPAMLWRTAFGGEQSERGWGVAASGSELYLVGATASQQTDAFPLWDFDPNDPLDLYQDWNLGGNTSSGMVPFYQFCFAMDHEFVPLGPIESLNTPHDGFITSFGTLVAVGTPELAAPSSAAEGLHVVPMEHDGTWMVTLPSYQMWTLDVVDAIGRTVIAATRVFQNFPISLQDQTAGIYMIRARSSLGKVAYFKVARQ